MSDDPIAETWQNRREIDRLKKLVARSLKGTGGARAPAGGGGPSGLVPHTHEGDGQGGLVDAAPLTFTPADLGDWGSVDPGGVADALDYLAANAGGSPDASVVTYTPNDDTDWAGSADPGNVDDALDQLADRVTTVEGGSGHDPVTLDANADTVLSLTTQELGLDDQAANTFLAGPTTGSDATPGFRTMVSDDLPVIYKTTDLATESYGTEAAEGSLTITGVLDLGYSQFTIASDKLTDVDGSLFEIISESGFTDDLISVTPLGAGNIMLLVADSGHTITLKHDDAGGTTNFKLFCQGGSDIVMTGSDCVLLAYNANLDANNGGWMAGLIGADASAALAAHIANTTAAHAASAISVLDTAAQYTATNVEDALAEVLDAEQAHEAAVDPHPGYVLESLLDAKGDLITASADNTPAKLTVGANDTILMADSAAGGGLKWVAPATPSTQAFGDAAAEGTADTYTRGDHKHAWPALGTTAAAVGTSAGGSATTPSKSDHVHATGAGTPSTQAFGDAAATGSGPAAAMTDHKHAMPANPVSTDQKTRAIPFTIDGGGSVITTGIKAYLHIPFGCTINQVSILSDAAPTSTNLVVDIKKVAYATTMASFTSIVASAPPTLTTTNRASKDATLTGWTTAITADDMLEISVTTAPGTTKFAVVTLKVTVT